jgi:hypothetical protein
MHPTSDTDSCSSFAKYNILYEERGKLEEEQAERLMEEGTSAGEILPPAQNTRK